MTISNFKEASRELFKFVPPIGATPYTLDTMHKLMDYLGNPQNKLKIIHVAGTSGKTSTSYYSAALLHETGVSVGLTVSPHVADINERLQIDMKPLPEKKYCAELTEFLDLIYKSHLKPSYFELLIAFAFWEFAKQRVDYAVVEVGLGGLLDGTNVIRRPDKVCVITDIGLDHVRVLGSTLSEIATQKAGIITDHNDVFSYRQGDDVVKVLEDAANAHNAKLHLLGPSEVFPGTEFLPTFQQRNFALAYASVEHTLRRDKLPALLENQTLDAAHTYIPGRMEIFHKDGKTIIIDGAHNAQKLNALVGAIKVQFPGKDCAVLVSFVAGAEERLETSMSEIAEISKNIIVTTFGGFQDTPKHSVSLQEISEASKKAGLDITIIERPDIAFAALQAQDEPILLVTGSFYLLNHIRPLLLKS